MGLIVLIGAACTDSETSHGRSARVVEPFPGSATSVDRLGGEVLGALARGDVGALERFRLTEREHNDVVWPELPASAPEIGFPVELAWSNIETRDRSAVARILPHYEGREPSFEGAECRGESARFETFEVLTDCWVLFETSDASEPLEAQIFKDVLVRGGGYKVFRYYDEAPRARRFGDDEAVRLAGGGR